MDIRVSLMLLLVFIPLSSHAQAFKCRTPSGKVVVTNQGCSDGAMLEKITTAAPVSLDQQLQAAQVNNRVLNQLGGIENEKAAYAQQSQRQQAAYARADAEQARIDTNKKAAEDLKHQQDECSKLSRRTDMPKSQRAALDEICGKPIPDKDRFDDCKEKLARASNSSQRAVIAASCTGDPNSLARVEEASRRRMDFPEPEAPAPLSIIKNCSGATCTDQTGQRYTTEAGKTVRSDGKRCYKQGSAMYCD